MKSYIRAVLGRDKAFTLIELLIVIAIIAILTVAFLPGALKAPAKARDAQRQKAVRDIQAATESYIAEHSGIIPLGAGGGVYCFTTAVIPAGSFQPLPIDPKVGNNTTQPNGSCNAAANNDKYFYKAATAAGAEATAAVPATFYVVGALVEVRGSGNTSATYSGAAAVAGGAPAVIAISSDTRANIAGTLNQAPDVNTPYFIVIGPQNI